MLSIKYILYKQFAVIELFFKPKWVHKYLDIFCTFYEKSFLSWPECCVAAYLLMTHFESWVSNIWPMHAGQPSHVFHHQTGV